MPSLRQPPAGGGSNTSAPAQDVKHPGLPSEPEAEAVETQRAASSEDSRPTPASKDLEVEEADLEALEEQKKVPYQRFKEKVDETKSLKERVARMEREQSLVAQRAAEDAELRVKARLDRERESAQQETMDPTERHLRNQSGEVNRLSRELNDLRTQSKLAEQKASISRLEQKYPEADSLAVLGWAKAQGREATDDIMEELMAESHNRTIERAKASVQKMIQHKKDKAKAAVPTREGGIRLKDSERPKNLKEAAALTRRFYGSGD